MALKAFLAAAAALAVGVGLVLPVPHHGDGHAKQSRFATVEVGRG